LHFTPKDIDLLSTALSLRHAPGFCEQLPQPLTNDYFLTGFQRHGNDLQLIV
jgi:hypothetical protein